MSDRFDLGSAWSCARVLRASGSTKRKPFWYSGLVVGVIGFGVAMSAYLLH
jgi:hypothetical protein